MARLIIGQYIESGPVMYVSPEAPTLPLRSQQLFHSNTALGLYFLSSSSSFLGRWVYSPFFVQQCSLFTITGYGGTICIAHTPSWTFAIATLRTAYERWCETTNNAAYFSFESVACRNQQVCRYCYRWDRPASVNFGTTFTHRSSADIQLFRFVLSLPLCHALNR